MKKRVLALLLSGVMVTGLLVGCGSANNDESAGNSESTEKSEVASNDEGKENAEKELDVVTILAPNRVNAVTNMDTSQWEEYPISQIVIEDLEEIGIRIELELLDIEGFTDAVRARMATGTNLPDMVSFTEWGCNQLDVVEWVEAGLLYCVDDLLEQYDEDGSIKAYYMEANPTLWGKNTLEDGKNYWFANGTNVGELYNMTSKRPYNLVQAAPGNAIREDWINAVGEEVKENYSVEELSALLKKMYDEDANGNGVSDELLYVNPENFANGIASAFELTPHLLAGCYEEDGIMFSNFYHENFPAYVEFLNDLYEYGVLDTRALSTSSQEMIAANIISMVTTGYAMDTHENFLTGDVDGYYAPVMVDMDGNLENGFTTFSDYYANSQGAIFIPKTNENPEPVMRLLDYCFTEEYQFLYAFGREGVNYTIDEETGVKVVDWGQYGTTFENASMYQTGVGEFVFPRVVKSEYASAPNYDDLENNKAQRKEWWLYEKYINEYIPNAEHIVMNSNIFGLPTAEEQETLNKVTNTLETYAKELLVDLILGNKSLDDLATYQAEMEKLGLQDYIDVCQARRDRAFGK